MTILILTVNSKNGTHSPMISKETHDIVMENAEVLNSAVIYDRDFNYVSIVISHS